MPRRIPSPSSIREAPIVLPRRSGPEPSYEIVFLGDTYLGESYEAKRIRAGKTPDLARREASSFFDGVRHLVAGADFCIANLEAPMTSLATSPLGGQKKYIHRAHPETTIAALQEIGVRAVSLANNHACDFGFEGLRESMDGMQRGGIHALGVGSTQADAASPLFLETPGPEKPIRLAILAAYDVRPQLSRFYQDAVRPGAMLRVEQDDLATRVADLRRDEPDLHIVVFVHWGSNYAPVTERQRLLAKALAASGASLVIGHGSHTIQDFERIGSCLVAYSLGNFVFNSRGRFVATGSEAIGLVARLLVRPTRSAPLVLRLHPILTDNRVTRYQTRPLDLEALAPLVRRFAGAGLQNVRIRARDRSVEIPLVTSAEAPRRNASRGRRKREGSSSEAA